MPKLFTTSILRPRSIASKTKPKTSKRVVGPVLCRRRHADALRRIGGPARMGWARLARRDAVKQCGSLRPAASALWVYVSSFREGPGLLNVAVALRFSASRGYRQIYRNVRSATPARRVRYHGSGRGGSNCAGAPNGRFSIAANVKPRVDNLIPLPPCARRTCHTGLSLLFEVGVRPPHDGMRRMRRLNLSDAVTAD